MCHARDKRAIPFDRDDTTDARNQPTGERPCPCPDLDHDVTTIGPDGIDDSIENARICEEMLAEPAAH